MYCLMEDNAKDVEREQDILKAYENGFFKKLFSVPCSNYILEVYTDCRNRDTVCFQWAAHFELPQIIVDLTDGEYLKAWSEYKQEGTALRFDRTRRKEIEQEKNRAVQSVEMGPEEKFAIRMYETMKFVCKDRRLK